MWTIPFFTNGSCVTLLTFLLELAFTQLSLLNEHEHVNVPDKKNEDYKQRDQREQREGKQDCSPSLFSPLSL